MNTRSVPQLPRAASSPVSGKRPTFESRSAPSTRMVFLAWSQIPTMSKRMSTTPSFSVGRKIAAWPRITSRTGGGTSRITPSSISNELFRPAQLRDSRNPKTWRSRVCGKTLRTELIARGSSSTGTSRDTTVGEQGCVERSVAHALAQRVEPHRPRGADEQPDAFEREGPHELVARIELDGCDRENGKVVGTVRQPCRDQADRLQPEALEQSELQNAGVLAPVTIEEQKSAAADGGRVDREADAVRRLEPERPAPVGLPGFVLRWWQGGGQADALDRRRERPPLDRQRAGHLDAQLRVVALTHRRERQRDVGDAHAERFLA